MTFDRPSPAPRRWLVIGLKSQRGDNHMELLRYDPLEHIDPDAWLELDETERKQLVVRYHRKEKIRLPNETTHALIHVIVENRRHSETSIRSSGYFSA